MNDRTPIAAILMLIASFGLSAAKQPDGPWTFSSGGTRVALLELYTSEGCSSCPPADRWLSGLEDHPDLFRTFVPIAFHVDYWNYIGWRDRFSDKDYSNRQRRYIDEGAARAVYTPGFFRAGEEWLGWRRPRPVIADEQGDAGELSVRVEDGQLAARYVANANTHDALDLHVTLLGMNLETEVRAGENRGRKLEHDFVVLTHSVTRLDPAGSSWGGVASIRTDGLETNDVAIAVWVSEPGDQAPLQATGGYLGMR